MARLVLEVYVNENSWLEDNGFAVKTLKSINTSYREWPEWLIVAPKGQPKFMKVEKDDAIIEALLRVASGRGDPLPGFEELFKLASKFLEENAHKLRDLTNEVRSALLSFLNNILSDGDTYERISKLFKRSFILPLGNYAINVIPPVIEVPNAWEILAATAIAETPLFVKVRGEYRIETIAPLFQNQPILTILNRLAKKPVRDMIKDIDMSILTSSPP